MAEVMSARQMRAVEEAAIESGECRGLDLMERAGEGVVEALLSRWPAMRAVPGRCVIHCGTGNNGGDGFVVARLLAGLGWEVVVWLWGNPDRLSGDARRNFDVWRAIGSVRRVGPEMPAGVTVSTEPPPDLFIDALLGTGLTRDLDLPIKRELEAIQRFREAQPDRLRCVAIDVPSGLCADSGRNRGNACRYDLTVTFHTAKPGHYLESGPMVCGTLAVVGIGLPGQADPDARSVDCVGVVDGPGPVAKTAGHKFDYGHAVVVSGGVGQGGAARLAARAALRVGAGLVTLACPPPATTENAAQLNAVMLRQIDDGAALADWLSDDSRIRSVCIGPGLGMDDRAAAQVHATLGSGKAAVLDADALSLLAADRDLMTRLYPGSVLTPHGGEFARLFPDIAEALSVSPVSGQLMSKIDATRAAAKRAGCTVLFKGPDTVIADQTGKVAIHPAAYARAAPWLATAGAGDVLAGLISGLLARGFAPMDAACSAAFLHVETALSFGPGLIAEDLPDELPRVLRRLAL